MKFRIIIPLCATLLLAACGACEGYANNSGSSARCGLSFPW